jgi:predicted dehydrogenase
MTLSRRRAIQIAAGAIAAPMVFRNFAHAAPSETLLHVSVGAGGMARADINSLTESKNLKLVAVADVDSRQVGDLTKKFPDLKVYTDWREMFEKEKFDSVNVSTPDHMHACPTMRAMLMGKHVYTQKPLTQTLHECRKLTEVAAANPKLVSQMGIQIHSERDHKRVVAMIQDGVIGKVKEVHSWSNKTWGDPGKQPAKTEPAPKELDFDKWLGVAADRPYIGGGYFHPGNWRKRLDFGTGTFGDMGCHILDPVFGAIGVKSPKSITSTGGVPNEHHWAVDVQVQYIFPGSKFTTDEVSLTWYDGKKRPPAEAVTKLMGDTKLSDQGSIYVGEKGMLYSVYLAAPKLFVDGKAVETKLPDLKSDNHYLQFVDAARGEGKTSAPFSYAGPLTEMVLLGCLSTRFPKTALKWDTAKMEFTNEQKANAFVKRAVRKGWAEKGL